MYLLVVATQIILDMLVNMTVNTEQLSMAHANVTIVIMIIPAHYHAPALGTVLTGHVIVDFSHPPCLTTSTSRSSQGNITIASEVTII
jgi:predicted dinucleotide-binding enzyme